MKKTLFSFCTLLVFTLSHAQVNPTLGVGLETLTMNKGTIDVEVLTKIIMEKQKELKGEALKRFMLKLFPDANYTTKFYIQNCLHILLNEKNPQVIEKEILELTTNYALALGVTYALVKSRDGRQNAFHEDILRKIDSAYAVYKGKSGYLENKRHYLSTVITKIRGHKTLSLYLNRNLLEQEFKKHNAQKTRESHKPKTKIIDFYAYKNDTLILEDRIKRQSSVIFKMMRRRNINDDDKSYKRIRDIAISIYDNIDSIFINKAINRKTQTQFKDNLIRLKIPQLQKITDLVSTKIKENNTLIKKKENLKLIKKINDSIASFNSDNYLSSLNEATILPFGILLDVVSLSLSDMEQLKKKGFFKNRVDYRASEAYTNLNESGRGLKFRISLDTLKKDICNKIEPYIINYEVIKELISKKNNITDKTEIIKILEDQAILLLRNSDQVRNQMYELNKLLSALEEIEVFKKDLNVNNTATVKDINYQMSLVNELSKNLNLYSEEFGICEILFEKNIDQKKYIISDFLTLKTIPSNSDDKMWDKIVEAKSIKQTLYNLMLTIEQIKQLPENITSENPINRLEDSLTKLKTDITNIKTVTDNIPYTYLRGLIDIKKKGAYTDVVGREGSYRDFLNTVIDSVKNYDIKSTVIDTLAISKTAKPLADIYSKLTNIVETDNISLTDITYIEKEVLNLFVELKIRDRNPSKNVYYDILIDNTKIIISLLKIKAIKNLKLGKYEPELMTLFEFIANLDKLDKAQTFTSIVDMLRTGSDKVEDQLAPGEFKDGYLIFINAMKKYTLVNTTKNYVEIDVASFLNELQTYYNRNNNSVCSLYLSIGLNENIFIGGDFKYPNSDQKLDNIGFASEKLGLKFRLHSFTKYGGYENAIKNDVYLNTKAPFINDLYAIVYGSGLLYSLANTATDENFDFAHIGVGFGLRFYNALDVNFTLGLPFVKDGHFGDYPFIGIGFDIPLGEYLEKLGK